MEVVNLKITLYADFVLDIIPGRQCTHEWLYLLFNIMSKHLHFLYISIISTCMLMNCSTLTVDR